MSTTDLVVAAVAATLLTSAFIGIASIMLPPLVRHLLVGWTRVVSRPWPAKTRQRSLDEARSHAFEHFHDPTEAGHSALQLAVVLLIQLLAGIPGDIRWMWHGVEGRRRRRQLAAMVRSATLGTDGSFVVLKTEMGLEAYVLDERGRIASWDSRLGFDEFPKTWPPPPSLKRARRPRKRTRVPQRRQTER